MARQLTQHVLERETEAFRGSGGTSQQNRCLGFRPAFLDTRTQTVYPSRFPNGAPAPFHLIDALPDEAVAHRDPSGRAIALKTSVVSGFLRDGHFYTREEAATACAGN
jgi:hypothetical protein